MAKYIYMLLYHRLLVQMKLPEESIIYKLESEMESLFYFRALNQLSIIGLKIRLYFNLISKIVVVLT